MKALKDLFNLWSPDPSRLERPEVQLVIAKAQEILGYPGKMISGSKSGYSKAHKPNVPVFNSNICTKEFGKIWFGDIDLTLEGDKLQALSEALKVMVYVLREHDARFEKENNPDFKNFVVAYDPNLTVGSSLKDQVEISKKGKFSGKIVYKQEYR